MGVRGLTSFFDHNPILSKDHKLHNCPVVIDGNNLVHFLYFTNKLDCVYGGDYHRFSEVVRKQISLYLECNIRPIVIFDGGYDSSDRKLATVFQRSKQRLTNVQHIAKYGCCSGKVLPILAVEVVKSVLQSMGVTLAQCDYEADEQIMLLANHYNCPVISQDSDFYIFDISQGFIRLDFIGSEVVREIDEDGNECKYLKCQIYRIDYFISLFPGMNKALLPLFSTLIGNDIAHINTFENFFANIRLPKFKGKLKVRQRHKKMIGLLSWLQNYTIDDAIEQVLSCVKLKKREQVRALIDQAINSYKPESCIVLDDSENSFPCSLKTFGEKSVPPWFMRDIRCARISPFLLNALTLHRNFLPSQVEDVTLESSFKCSLYIRQIIYSILLTYDLEGVDNATSSVNYVKEYDRRSGNLYKESVFPLSDIVGFGTVPSLETVYALDVSFCRDLLCKVIGDDLKYFSCIPQEFQLLFGCCRYWLRHCQPKPPVELLYSVTLTVILFSIVLPSSVPAHSNCIDEGNSQELNTLIKNVQSTDSTCFRNNMKKYFQKPQHSNANPMVLQNIHHFGQLQTCVLFLTYLNKLLKDPFENINITGCINGTVFYNLAKDLTLRSSVELFVSELLGRGSALDVLYVKLKNKVLEDIPEDCFMKKNSLNNSSRGKKKKRSTQSNQKSNGSKELERNCTSALDSFQTLDIDHEVDVFL